MKSFELIGLRNLARQTLEHMEKELEATPKELHAAKYLSDQLLSCCQVLTAQSHCDTQCPHDND